MRLKSQPLYAYQQRAQTFSYDKTKIGFFVFYGGGKSYLILEWLVSAWLQGKMVLPALVLCPGAAHIRQWVTEVKKHTEGLSTVGVLGEEPKKRIECLETEADIHIINYDAFRSPKLFDWFKARPRQYQTIIADESTRLKDGQTKRFKTINKLFWQIPYRAILTGMPILEKPEELWGQYFFLDQGETFSRSFWEFRYRYFAPGGPWAPYDWSLKQGAGEQIAERIKQTSLYIPKTEILSELPPKVYNEIVFEMPDDTRVKYEELKKEFRTELDSGKVIETIWAPVKAMKLHQLAQGLVYLENDAHETLNIDKVEWIVENVPDMLQQGPVIIWGYLLKQLYLVYAALEVAEIKTSLFTGDMRDKQEQLDAFLQGKTNVLVASVQAGHEGLNLQRACHAIYASSPPHRGMRNNSEDRCHRLGSQIHESVTYWDLITTRSIDVVYRNFHKTKGELADLILKHLHED